MSHIERIFGYHSANSAEIAEASAHSHKGGIGLDGIEPGNLFKLVGNKILNLLRPLLRIGHVRLEKVGKRNRSEGKRFVVYKIAPVVINEICRAAAHFHNQALGNIHRVDNALIDKHCLLLYGQHLDFYAAGHSYLVKEALLIFRPAYCRRGVCEYLVHVICVAKPAEHRKRLYSLSNSLGLDKSVPIHILSQADGFLKLVENDEIAAVEYVNQNQPCRV